MLKGTVSFEREEMAKKYYDNNGSKARYENWESPKGGMPESDLGGSKAGIDKQIKKDNIKNINIKPRAI